jgi:peptide/nickel transport system substrate-binding protein
MSRRTLAAFLSLLVSLSAACSKSPPPEEGVVSEKPEYGDELVMGSFHQPDVINPLTTHSTIAANLQDLIFDSLVDFADEKSDVKFLPALAERWEVSDDGLLWTFFLRKGVLFHDGVELTAEDVKFTFEQIAKMKRHAYRTHFKYVKSFSAPDRYIFRMELSRYDSQTIFPFVISIAPRHLLEGQDPRRTPFHRKPIGTGPFRFVSRNDEEIVLEANENHFRGRPWLNRFRLKVVRSPQAYIDLAVGKIDLISMVDEEYYQFLSRLPEIRVYRTRGAPFFYFLVFNTRKEIFRSSKIRQAIDRLIDRERLAALMPEEKVTVADGPLPPWRAEYKPSPPAGPLPELPPIRFTISADESELNRRIVAEIQSQLWKAGVQAEGKFLPITDQIAEFKRGNFDMILIRNPYLPWFLPYYDYWHSSEIGAGFNVFSYSNPLADEALDRVRFRPEGEERRQGYFDLQKVFREDPPAVFLFWRYLPFAIHKRFRGVLESNMINFKTYRELWVPKEEQKYE